VLEQALQEVRIVSAMWRQALHTALNGLRDLALSMLIVGGGQVVLGLILWPLIFRRQELGFSMALSLVGFGSWLLSFIMSFTSRRGRLNNEMPIEPPRAFEDHPVLESVQDQIQRTGCGFMLLISSSIPLGIALLLRLQHDLRTGLELREIFPPMP
jgi:hypothetical protein